MRQKCQRIKTHGLAGMVVLSSCARINLVFMLKIIVIIVVDWCLAKLCLIINCLIVVPISNTLGNSPQQSNTSQT